ncbi:sigma 54-interacting transcriptional regulator [Tunturiibacter gelidoferens]|uniref:Formate hydrogenlyase transcriptional activator n=1 Tax=Tunturiibacter lichenicola TaxID=2051959 RepID=A0A7Y9NNL4_9BACT|nr:sigma 54-interacting transcriptional regulator [Edaphobacter lichenicola]NYF52103.1 formate hydrogenlyase transcriptional activator [Edaphobacter lichenicola]
MRSSPLHHISPVDIATNVEQMGDLLRFAHNLDAYRDPEQLLRCLPAELSSVVVSNTTALIQMTGTDLSWYAVDGETSAIGLQPDLPQRRDEISEFLTAHQQPVVLASLDREARFPGIVRFFRTHGNQSLCVLPLNKAGGRAGALCFARKEPDGFSEREVGLLSFLSDYVGLAIDDRLNLAHSEAVRAQLESEQTKLNLILDLNNSVVSNLELGEVLRSVSPNIRKTMRLESVAVMLPDTAHEHLQLYAVDFSDRKENLFQHMSGPVEGSLAGQVFCSGKPWVGDREEWNISSSENRASLGDGTVTICMIPLIRCKNVLGVLCLARAQKSGFTREDIEFLSQIAGQVAIAIDNAFAYQRITELSDKLRQEKLYLEDEIRSELNFEEIIGNSAVLRQVLRQVEAVAPTNSTVLIQGETGSGKELIARAVHNLSRRRTHPFVKLNCAAIPTGLLESELFGHEKGAFTGAIAQRMGRFELASQGTIFLDEVSEIPLDLQPKLLRVLQEREFERLGNSRTLRTDARLIAATNRDLNAMVEEQRFRSDLFYRLNVFPIYVPPLRERKEDIPFLVRHFAQHFARNMSKEIDTISTETMNSMVSYPWPGNIRELQNVIERAVILSKGPELQVPLAGLKTKPTDANGQLNGATTLEEIERKHILSILEQTNWVFAGPNGAAARLGIKRPTLQFRMQKLGISRPRKL